jgi:nicotinamide riboside kinase
LQKPIVKINSYNQPLIFALKIAILGAESTGKSELVKQLLQHFLALEKSVQHVPEYLRTWCDQNKRTPRKDEQLAIATEQIRQINSASTYDLLLADTTALTVAVYSELLFKDASLYDMAIAHQRAFDATLLMGLDLPWVADGIQRDGAHMREPVDTALRAALCCGGIQFQVVYGMGESRLQNALRCFNSAFEGTEDSESDNTSMDQNRPQRLRNWVCERCSDPVCEHRLFRDLIRK